MRWPPRRVVTGHDGNGNSVVVSDGAPPLIQDVARGGGVTAEMWATHSAPTPIPATEPEPNGTPIQIPPSADGTVFRYFEIRPGWRSPMHRTQSVDYGLVLDGEVWMILDDGSETLLRAGDVAIQRGTDHVWENRSDTSALMAFVLVDGAFTPELLESIGEKAAQLIVDLPEH